MKYKTKPWLHQKELTELLSLRTKPYWALFWDMGTGKTKQACDIMRLTAYQLDRIPKTLIIGPVVVMNNWLEEIERHTYFDTKKVQVVDGQTKPNGKKNKNPTKKLKIEQVEDQKKDIFIISTETVSDAGGSVFDHLRRAHDFELLIVDEVHNFKNPTGVRTKALHKFTRQPSLNWRYILTGSPVLQNALDLWAQFYILSPEILGANYFSYRSKYFYDANAGMPSDVHFPNWQPKDDKYFKRMGYKEEESLKGLNKVIYQHANRVMKSDTLDLPDMVYQKVEVEMPSKQRKIYDDFKNTLIAFLEGQHIKEFLNEALAQSLLGEIELPESMRADTAIVQTIRLQQLICGIFTTEEGEIKHIENNRLKVLKGLLESIGSNPENKIIVWTTFTPTYEPIAELCKSLGLAYTFLTGLQNKEEKDANVKAFNTDDKIQVIIANQGAGGTGINLTAANYAVYFSRSFNLAHDLQSEARNYRGGQKRKVTRIDLVTPDTIDASILDRLAEKKAHAEDILKTKEFSAKEVLKLI